MNRKTFFKKLGISAAAVVVAPKILTEVSQELYPIGEGEMGINDILVMKERLQNNIANIPDSILFSNKELIKIFEESPETADIIREMCNGKSFRQALEDNFLK
jgi:hypothetical protein